MRLKKVGLIAMSKKDKPGEMPADYYKTLRARFAGKPVPADAPLVAQAPADPAAAWFGAAPAEDEPAARARFDASSLRAKADMLAARIDRRADAHITLGAYGMRLGVGAIWLVAGALFLTTRGGVDAAVLGRLFMLIAGAGIGAALLGAMVTTLTARPQAKRIKTESAMLGGDIAREARALSDTLDDNTNSSLTGIEADMFLKNVRFADGGEQSGDRFTSYLYRDAPRTSSASHAGALLVAAFALAAGLGALITPALNLPLPAIATASPIAFATIIAGVILYAGAGIIAAGFGGSARAGITERTTNEALGAVQAGFANVEPPSIESLAARLQPAPALEPTPAALHEPDFESKNTPQTNPQTQLDWRTRDSGPQFVDTGFQAAPKTFRVDAGVKKNQKKNR